MDNNKTNLATREEWANKVIDAYRPIFDKAGLPLPDRIRVGFGFTSKGARVSAKTKEIVAKAEALHVGRSEDETMEIIIAISEGDAGNVVRLIVKAMLEGTILSKETAKNPQRAASLKLDAELRKAVRASAVKLGFDTEKPLDGKMDFPWNEHGAAFAANVVENELGGFAHAAVVLAMPKKPKAKPEGTRMLKVFCPHTDGDGDDAKPCQFKVRASSGIIAQAMAAGWTCPIHHDKLVVDEGSKAKAGITGTKGKARIGNVNADVTTAKNTAAEKEAKRLAKRAKTPPAKRAGGGRHVVAEPPTAAAA